jgi:hypothetical protein
MNLPDYRRALNKAMGNYADTVEKARLVLEADLAKANSAFLDDDDNVPMEAEKSYERAR